MSARDKAGEVLAAHRIEGVGPGGECWCACGMGDEGHGTLWNAEGHRAHVVDALAEAGLLREDDWRHVAELERLRAEENRYRAEKAERERDEWKQRRDNAVETCRFRHQDGLTAHEWHIRICGAMQGAVERERERDEAREALARVEALTEPGWHTNRGHEYSNLGDAYAAGRNDFINRLRAALRGDDA